MTDRALRTLKALRLAWTAFCGLVCVLLVVLWVQSFWSGNELQGVIGSKRLQLDSATGRVWAYIYPDALSLNPNRAWVRYRLWPPPQPPHEWYFGRLKAGEFKISLPAWIPLVLMATLPTAPWIALRRFSLRTLLIAITLAAVVLGLTSAAGIFGLAGS